MARFHAEAAVFAEAMVQQLVALGLSAEITAVDHVCYRIADLATYERRRLEFEKMAILLSEAFINGRPIASYKLIEPIRLKSGFDVYVVELPAPKPGVAYEEGFEHIEVVTRSSLESFMAQFPTLKFKTSNLNAPINRDISLPLTGGLVKFHERSLEDIIALEQEALTRRTQRRVALFDFDDTLVASRQPFLLAFHKALATHLGTSLSFDDFRKKARPTFPEFFANFGITTADDMEETLAIFKREWQAVEHQCATPVGIASFLSCLRSEGVELHVWTARDGDTTDSCLEAVGLRKYFTSITAFDARQASKPVPSAHLKEVCAGARGVHIGDSDTDRICAANLGFGFVQATWVHNFDLPVDAAARCESPMLGLTRALALLS